MSASPVMARKRQIRQLAVFKSHPKGDVNDWCSNNELFQGLVGTFVESISVQVFPLRVFSKIP